MTGNRIRTTMKKEIKQYKFPHSAIFQPICPRSFTELVNGCNNMKTSKFTDIPNYDDRACECNIQESS